jgi:pimeloyl-ACP methyl ester carboxylesterase
VQARLNGVGIGYQDQGRGRALLLLHAFPLDRSMWDPQAAALESSQRVIRFDARGFGGSDDPSGSLTMEAIADDAAALLTELEIEQAVLVGCSMGGYAAFAFARRHTSRLAALVLLDTRAGADGDEARRNRAALAERVLAEGAGAAVEALLPRLLGVTSRGERPELVGRVRQQILAARPRAIAAALAGLAARLDSTPLLASLGVPTLVVVGEEDVITPPAGAAEMASLIPGARLATIPRAGHLPGLENPEALNGTLAAFLAALPR